MVIILTDWEDNKLEMSADNFKIGSEADKFNINFDTITPPQFDGLQLHKGKFDGLWLHKGKLITLVTSAWFSVGDTLGGGGICIPSF